MKLAAKKKSIMCGINRCLLTIERYEQIKKPQQLLKIYKIEIKTAQIGCFWGKTAKMRGLGQKLKVKTFGN